MRRQDSVMSFEEVHSASRKGGKEPNHNALDIRVLGVCTGAGLDELGCALVRYRQDAPNSSLNVELIQYNEISVSSEERFPLLNTLREAQSKPAAVPRLNALLGHMFCNGIKKFCENHDIDLTSLDLIGTYTPPLRRARMPETEDWNTHPFGWNAVITARLGISVVVDFSVIENSTPKPNLSPTAFVDKVFLRHPSKFRACLNIGDLTTLSFIPPLVDGNTRGTMSRHCGPGSLLIDYAVRYCTSNSHAADNDGEHAAPGSINQEIVDRFLHAHDYLRTLPPLIIAREMFGDHEAQRLIDECLFVNLSEADTIATITRVTAQNIVKQYHRLLALYFPSGQKVDELFICGPSARNSNIIDYLEVELPENVITKPLDDIGIPGDANEAVSFAHLALETVLGQVTRSSAPTSPSSSSSSAAFDAVRGKILCGNRWETLLAKVHAFADGKPLQLSNDIRFARDLKPSIKAVGS